MFEKIKNSLKDNTRQKITTVIFLIIITVMFLGMFTSFRSIGGSFINTYRATVPTGAPYLQRVNGAIDALEGAVNDGAFQRQSFVELYGLAQLAMNKDVITDVNYGALYKTPYGQTTFAVPKKYVDDACTQTGQLANALNDKGIPFLYIQLPYKLPPYEYMDVPQLPANVHDYSNENADEFVSKISKSGIEVYDIRKEFWESGMTQNELFFNTDHHWTIEGSFLATKLIAQRLHDDYGFSLEPGLFDMKNFNEKKYEKNYLGSMGRRVGQIYGGTDNFTLITPNFNNHYILKQMDGEGKVFEGIFDQAILENHYVDDTAIDTNRYAVYHGDYEELQFVNTLAGNDDKVLIIKDSFGIPIYSFLSLGIHEVRAIDLRLFNRNVAEYAEDFDPDLVILMYNADSYSPQMFTFNLDK